jgi:hypothetical protein
MTAFIFYQLGSSVAVDNTPAFTTTTPPFLKKAAVEASFAQVWPRHFWCAQ